MQGKYQQIVRIERIQNERWYKQYLIHRHDLRHRLQLDTEKLLYHGCDESLVNMIISDCFNRNVAKDHSKLRY